MMRDIDSVRSKTNDDSILLFMMPITSVGIEQYQ